MGTRKDGPNAAGIHEVRIRLDRHTRKILIAASEDLGMPMSAFCRWAIHNELRRWLDESSNRMGSDR